MKQSKLLWRTIGVVAVLATCFFIVGFGYAIKTVVYPQSTNIQIALPTQVEDTMLDDDFIILGLGDSLTKGTGDQSSQGYIRHVFDALKEAREGKVKLINLAVNGYRTTQLLDDISERPGVIAAIKQADAITFTIGGNDLFSVGEEVDLAVVRDRMPESIRSIHHIMSKLIEINSHAKIYYIGLYNPFIDMVDAEEISLFVQEWNHEVFKIVNHYPQITLVPTFDLFTRDVKAYLSSDHYHPNEAGYARIAERIVQNISAKAIGKEE